ncbi:MAG TPA: glutamine--tRNA ligase/YqeY domain fusion protein, partial [Candidatus Aminicenantes bacterium]|nr:glutamine--tRNA ligase/YqeY domain fusion protein [Candidatus Aminicenantes bacterium]
GNFIREIIDADRQGGKNGGQVHTRFPPEPNGYLHIGHAKSICLNFGLAREYDGLCNLRFDDTNPAKEDVEYVDSIQEDVHWLGFDWQERMYYASDYFDRLYEFAEVLIGQGDAYVCDLTPEQIREYRGTLTEPGKASPRRDRPAAESLELFRAMRAGRFPDGHCVLRARIDMASPNLNLRDPVLYRIKRETHHRTGDKWCIYPMYDYAHPVSDAIEGITHSICTLEFEDHRPFYDWVLDRLPMLPHPRQIEFARLNLTYTLMSKRKLLDLVQRRIVSGWDDPRMPTIAGLRRRGYTPEAIRSFAETIGVAKRDSTVDAALLEYCLREDLNRRARRVMAVLRPLKVVIENYPEGQVEWFDAENNPEDPSAGSRKVPFSREIYIERDDFREDPPKKYFRLSPGKEIRLKFAYYITCTGVTRDPTSGEVIELRCTYDPASRGGWTADGRKVLGTSHWVSAAHSLPAEVRLYDKLFLNENPTAEGEGGSYLDALNPASLEVLTDCRVEPSLAGARPDQPLQFLRQAYFCLDRVDSRA